MAIGPWQILIILLIVLLIFGTKKLRNIGGDLGGAIKDFKKGMRDGDPGEAPQNGRVVEGDAPSRTQVKEDQSKPHV